VQPTSPSAAISKGESRNNWVKRSFSTARAYAMEIILDVSEHPCECSMFLRVADVMNTGYSAYAAIV
jgi:hypothetical protein